MSGYINILQSKLGKLNWILKQQPYWASRRFKGLYESISLNLNNPDETSELYISFCTTIKDRLEHIQKTFLCNIKNNENYPNCEFLLLNYNCPNPNTDLWVREQLQSYIDTGRMNYYFYPDSKYFERSHARNLAFRLAKGEIICNLDADNFSGKGFARYISTVMSLGNIFLSGPVDGRGLGGRICVRREHWKAIGGYDERFKDWGSEDGDLASRLEMLGVEKHIIKPEKFCRTIFHSDELRTRYHREKNKDASMSQLSSVLEENAKLKVLNPNGDSFGRGRVQKNFSEWLEV